MGGQDVGARREKGTGRRRCAQEKMVTAKAINQSFGEEESVSLQDFTFPQALPPRSRQHAQLRRSARPRRQCPPPAPRS